MQLSPSTIDDLPEITDWIAADPFHQGMSSTFWLTGSDCHYAGKVSDNKGTLGYVRVEELDGGYRMHTQFSNTASKMRLVTGIIEFIRAEVQYAKHMGKTFLITDSINPSLVRFLKKLGFEDVGNNDLKLQVNQ